MEVLHLICIIFAEQKKDKYIMSKQEVILCEELESSLTTAIGNCPHDKLFILTDEHTHRLCLPQLCNIPTLKEATEIIIGAEDGRCFRRRQDRYQLQRAEE